VGCTGVFFSRRGPGEGVSASASSGTRKAPDLGKQALPVSKIEHHFDCAMPVLLTTDDKRIAILIEPEAMGYQPRRVDSFLCQQA
jgi:hypothetical protein